MSKILIISPHFPPTNAADMQRVRLLLPHLAAAGIDAEVLAVDSAQVASPPDSWLENGLPPDLQIHRVKAFGLRWSGIPGLGILDFRAMRALARAGDDLLSSRQFALIYFSTTVFGIHVLGPRWKKKFRVPFVMDYQDPWVSDYYRQHPDTLPPGGRLKYGIASWLNRRLEPRVLRECAGITTVSAAYPKQLERRYGSAETRGRRSEVGSQETGDGTQESGVREQGSGAIRIHGRELPVLVAPFPGDEQDSERVRESNSRQRVFDPDDAEKHWVYIGRGGEDMALAVRSIFTALSESRSSTSGSRLPTPDLRLHFIGTSYAAAGRGVKTIEPLAKEYGLEDLVVEYPDRIPYSETLRCLLDADALIVPGSDDPGYTASKIYPYLLARKPLLAVFHEQSSVADLVRDVGGGICVPFGSSDSVDQIAHRIRRDWFDSRAWREPTPLDERAFAPHTAQQQAACLKGFFDSVRSPEEES